MYGESEEMSSALARIQQAGESTFREVFAGIEVVPEKGLAIVYRIPSAEFDAFIQEAAGGQSILVRDAEHSNAELTVLQNRISDDSDFWRERGIAINMIATNHTGSGVVVGTSDVEKAQVELPAHYGPAIPIQIERMGQAVPLAGG